MKTLLKKQPYQLPTILGLFFLLAGLIAAVFLIKNKQIFFLKANPDITPRELKITNITDTSFTASWITSKGVNGFVKIEKKDEESFFADDRDQISGQIGEFVTHYVTVKNLAPSERYFFWIGSGGKIFDDEGKPFEMTTGPRLSQLSPLVDPAYGRIETGEGEPAEGAIVYLDLPNVIQQSALVKSSGSWLITLSLARSSDLTSFASYDRQTAVEKIFIQGGELGTAMATLTTEADSPAPTLVLGKSSVSLVEEENFSRPPTSTPLPPSVSPASGFQVEDVVISQPPVKLDIVYPVEGEVVSRGKPEFFGQGPEKRVLTIIVNSQGFFGQVVTDEQGSWSWTPPENLEPGKHKLTVRYQDEDGQTKTIERQFTVLAAGESNLPAFTSTPSATPLLPSPTLPPRTTQPSTEPGIPKPGVLTPTFLVSIMGIGIFLMGIFLRAY